MKKTTFFETTGIITKANLHFDVSGPDPAFCHSCQATPKNMLSSCKTPEEWYIDNVGDIFFTISIVYIDKNHNLSKDSISILLNTLYGEPTQEQELSNIAYLFNTTHVKELIGRKLKLIFVSELEPIGDNTIVAYTPIEKGDSFIIPSYILAYYIPNVCKESGIYSKNDVYETFS